MRKMYSYEQQKFLDHVFFNFYFCYYFFTKHHFDEKWSTYFLIFAPISMRENTFKWLPSVKELSESLF